MAKVTLHATIFGEDGIKTRDYETALIPDAMLLFTKTTALVVRLLIRLQLEILMQEPEFILCW